MKQTFIETLKKLYNKGCLRNLPHKWSNIRCYKSCFLLQSQPPCQHANLMHPKKNQPRRIYLSYPAGQPSSATSGTALFWDSHEGWVHMLYGGTSALALAPEWHTAVQRRASALAVSTIASSCTDVLLWPLRMTGEGVSSSRRKQISELKYATTHDKLYHFTKHKESDLFLHIKWNIIMSGIRPWHLRVPSIYNHLIFYSTRHVRYVLIFCGFPLLISQLAQ